MNIRGFTKDFNLKVEGIESHCGSIFGVTSEDIHSRVRSSKNVIARFGIWYILSEIYKLSSVTIGEIYDRDHATVLNGLKRAKALNLETKLGLGNDRKIL